MKIKALATYQLNRESGKIDYEIKAFENPQRPAFTHVHVEMDETILFSTTLPKTVQTVTVEVTFECMKCDFKTASLKKMENHSETHVTLEPKPKEKTLKDCTPKEFQYEYNDTKAFEFNNIAVVREHRLRQHSVPWIGAHKHVYYWVELENGYAVGWNENPSRGWSFPVVKINRGKKVK